MEEADVLFVHVDVHKVAEATLLVVQVPTELIVGGDEGPNGALYILRLHLNGVPVPDVLPEGRWDDDLDPGSHVIRLITLLYLGVSLSGTPLRL